MYTYTASDAHLSMTSVRQGDVHVAQAQGATQGTRLAAHTSGAGAVSYRLPRRIRLLITGTAIAL